MDSDAPDRLYLETIMPHDLMSRCEQKKLYVKDGNRIWKWIEVSVSELQAEVVLRYGACIAMVRYEFINNK